MHIIITLLTAIAGLVWALYRLQQSGVNLNDFNPFHWMRRRQWEKRVGAKPLHCLERPMESAAVLLIGIVKMEGEMSREQKNVIHEIFENEFKLSSQQAQELFSSSTYLVQDMMDISLEVKDILTPSKEKFTPEIQDALIDMLKRVASSDTAITKGQETLIHSVAQFFGNKDTSPSAW